MTTPSLQCSWPGTAKGAGSPTHLHVFEMLFGLATTNLFSLFYHDSPISPGDLLQVTPLS